MANIQTVTGRISGSDMGVTLPHEHVFIDQRSIWSRPLSKEKEPLVDMKVSIENLGYLSRDMDLCKDNLVLDDADMLARELLMFKALGGKTIVDVTTRGLSPNPMALREMSRRVGLNIVAGCGYYVGLAHPPDMSAKTVDRLAEEMIKDIQVGFEGTDVKAGIIGEIGTSHPLADNEKKVLRAAARAQKSTGVAITVHNPWRGKHGLQIVDILESEGVDPSRIIMGHMDDMDEWRENMTFEFHSKIAERGVWIQFDDFGEENYCDAANFVHPRDIERVIALRRLISVGYLDSLLISQDVCMKTYTRAYGGYGYDHIQRTIVPMMNQLGISKAEVERIMVDNPRRAIAH